jgi:hypothetical protein
MDCRARWLWQYGSDDGVAHLGGDPFADHHGAKDDDEDEIDLVPGEGVQRMGKLQADAAGADQSWSSHHVYVSTAKKVGLVIYRFSAENVFRDSRQGNHGIQKICSISYFIDLLQYGMKNGYCL